MKASVPPALATLECNDLYTRAITRKSDDAKIILFFLLQFQSQEEASKSAVFGFHCSLSHFNHDSSEGGRSPFGNRAGFQMVS